VGAAAPPAAAPPDAGAAAPPALGAIGMSVGAAGEPPSVAEANHAWRGDPLQ